MRYHNITKDDMLNGDGLRVVLWVAGCAHACPGCHNPETWDAAGGIPFDQAAKDELFAELEKDYVSGVTFSGGDPLFPANRETVGALCREIRQRFPDKTIWCYTGYVFEKDILERMVPKWRYTGPLLQLIDVLVDGPFIEELKDITLLFRGSSNQRLIDVPKSLAAGKTVLWEHEE